MVLGETPIIPDPLEAGPPGAEKTETDGKTAEVEPQKIDVVSAEVLAAALAGLTAMVFEMIARRAGPQWRLRPTEAKQLSTSISAVVTKRVPAIKGWEEESALLGTVGVIVWARLAVKPKGGQRDPRDPGTEGQRQESSTQGAMFAGPQAHPD